MAHELLSLFCGCGGLDYGFHRSGFTTVRALDYCSDAVKTFNQNLGDNIAQESDLMNLRPEEFLKKVPASARPIGLIGGPPCQGFSIANVCANPDDPRNQLPFRFAELLSTANQKHRLHFFVFENVVGLTQPKHADLYSKIKTSLRQAGFNLFISELNASDFSVPQQRRRLFIVGLNSEMYPELEFVFPTGQRTESTVSSTIRGLPAPTFFHRDLTPETIAHHPNHWTMVPKSAKFTNGGSVTGRSFKRLAWDKLSPTVAYGNREVHVHPDGTRRLSVLEAMLLQGFSRDYILTGHLSAQITQISNAVPPPLAEAVARSIYSQITVRQQD